MEDKILEVLKTTFELEFVDTTCSQQSCEAWGDSMGKLNLVAELEETFDISIEPEEIRTIKSYEDIVRLLKEKGVE